MPLYDFECEGCGKVVELSRRIDSRDEPVDCVDCGRPSRRLISRTGIQFKGDCWSHDGYTTKREGE